MEKSIARGHTSPLPIPTLLHHYFHNMVTSRSEEAANHGLSYCGREISYNELAKRSKSASKSLRNILSRKLTEERLIIAIDVQPCIDLIAILLAILDIGASFLPVDSHSAINRVRYILHEARPVCIITDSKSVFTQDSDTMWWNFRVVDVGDLLMMYEANCCCDSGVAPLTADPVVNSEVTHEDSGNTLACVIYTSGSSGNPKGVKILHRTIMNRLLWQWNCIPFRENETCCFKTSLLFVDSVVEIFAPILQLVPLVIAPQGATSNPETFVELLEDTKVTRLTGVPSLLKSLLFYIMISGGKGRLKNLAMFMSNSETLTPSLCHKFFDIFPEDKTLYNFYGSTETMADVTWEVFTSKDDVCTKCNEGYMSIGRPMYNCTVYVTDENLSIVPRGEVGEICVAGMNVAYGYIDEQISSSFISNEYVHIDHNPVMYRTGDFALIHEDMLVFVGRRDLQVKIRGQRVNISEIERTVHECPAVNKAVILCHHFHEPQDVIVAYYQAKHGWTRSRAESAITAKCQKELPVYMRPRLVPVEDIPLQRHSGKTDRVALRKLYEKAFNRQSSDELAVMDEKGEKAVNIIALNLNLPKHAISKKKSFFELGGNSVTMMSTIVQFRQHNLHIPIEDFSRANTIQNILDHVRNTTPTDQIIYTDRYEVLPLRQVPDHHCIVDIFANSFVNKEPLDVLLGVTKLEFMVFANSLHQEALKSGLSLIVCDKTSGEIVGGDFLFDYAAGVKVEHHQSMAPILCLMQEFEGPIQKQLIDTNQSLMYNYCLCVHEDLPHPEQVKICHLIEGSVLQVAAKNGFSGVLTNNTNPVTQDICQHFFDYQILSSYCVRDFVFNGRRVFSHAPEDYRIKMMIKYI